MSDLAHKEVLAQARATASQIRQGIHTYLGTLALIAKANKERHWKVLGYDSWEAYVDGEFGAERLRLPAEHRQKAVEELRLAGLSQRAIGAALGVSKGTVANDLAEVVNSDHLPEIQGIDGKSYAASRPSHPAPRGEEPAPGSSAGAVNTDVDEDPVSPGSGDGTGESAAGPAGSPVSPTAVEDDTSSADASGTGHSSPVVRDDAAAAPPPADQSPAGGGERCPLCGASREALAGVAA